MTTEKVKPGDLELTEVCEAVLSESGYMSGENVLTPSEIAARLVPAIRQRVRSVPAGEAFGWFFGKAHEPQS
jgi:hypothetical protein